MAAASRRRGSRLLRRRRVPGPPQLRVGPLLVVLLLTLVVGLAAAYDKYLFLNDPRSEVEELVGAQELDGVKAGQEPYVVMFYSPTCPHCTCVPPS